LPDKRVHKASPSVALSESPDLSGAEGATQLTKPRSQHWFRSALFGAFAGLLLGALFGAACCWLIGQHDFLWQGLRIGAVIGLFGGTIIGLVERKVRGEFVRSDSATFIGAVYGLLPALLTLTVFGAGHGHGSAYFWVGIFFIGPMVGLLLGALLDRACEASRQKSWRTALGSAVVGVSACVGLVALMDITSRPLDANEVAAKAKRLILEEWSHKAELRSATIQNVTLTYQGADAYAGFVEATIDNHAEQLSLAVLVEEERIVALQLHCKSKPLAAIDWPDAKYFYDRTLLIKMGE
jgi:MFS family permease